MRSSCAKRRAVVLPEQFPGCGEQTRWPCAAVAADRSMRAEQRFDGLEQRLRFQHHAFAAAERAVVHGAMAIVREGAQVVHAHVHQSASRARRTMP